MAKELGNKVTLARRMGESEDTVTPFTVKERSDAKAEDPNALGEQLAEELIAIAKQILPPATAESQ